VDPASLWWAAGDPRPAALQFRQLIDVLRRRRYWVLGTVVVGMTLVLVASLLLPPRYTATAQIVVDIREAGQAATASDDEEPILQTYVAALTAADFLDRVRHSLALDPAFRAATARPGNAEQPRPPLWVGWSAWLRQRLLDWRSPSTQSGLLRRDSFARHPNVYQEHGSRVIAVAFSATNPTQAALVANRLAELFIAGDKEREREWARGQLRALDARIPRIEAALEDDETAIESYRLAHGIAGAKHPDLGDQQRAELTQQLTATQSDLTTQQAKLDFVRNLQRRGAGVGQLVENLDSPAAAALLQHETALQQAQAEVAATMGQEHPEALRLAAQLAEVRGKLVGAVTRAIDALGSTVAIDSARVRSLRRQLAGLQVASGAAAEAEPALRQLERKAAAAGQVYASLLQRREQLSDDEATSLTDLRLLSSAPTPDRPSSPSPLLFMLPALIVFSIGGGFLAVFTERLDQSFRNGRALERALAVPCLGSVPKIRRRRDRRPFADPLLADFSAPYGEAVRSLVAALLAAAPGQAPKTVLVSSSLPGEGRSMLAASLAGCFARVGKRTLLLDFDLRRAAGADGATGETGSVPLDRLVFDDRSAAGAVPLFSGLDADFLAVAAGPGDPLKPFVAGDVARLLSGLRELYDCIVIDGPPLLGTTEAALLAALADKVLFVVRADTRPETAEAALQLLSGPAACDGRLERVAAVLTQAEPASPERGWKGRGQRRPAPAAAIADAGAAASIAQPRPRGRAPAWGLWAGIVLLCLVIGGTLFALDRTPLALTHRIGQEAVKSAPG
jgi:polysaccharide biosynthesis transport protein